MLFCSICEDEVPFHTGSSRDKKDLVCKACVRITKDPKAGKLTGDEALQKVFEKSLEFQPKGLPEMKRLKLYCNFARDKVIMIDDVAIRFDENGNGDTPSHNRSKVTKFMKQRPGRLSIVEDAPVVVAEPTPAPPVVEEPKEEKELVPAFAEELAPVEEKVEAPEEAKATPKKRSRKSKKKDTED